MSAFYSLEAIRISLPSHKRRDRVTMSNENVTVSESQAIIQ